MKDPRVMADLQVLLDLQDLPEILADLTLLNSLKSLVIRTRDQARPMILLAKCKETRSRATKC